VRGADRLTTRRDAQRGVPRGAEGHLGQRPGGEEPGVEGVVGGGEGPADGDRLEGEEERRAASTGGAGIDVDDGAHLDHQTGLLERLASRGAARVLTRVHEPGRQRPASLAGLDAASYEQQPSLLVEHDDADPDLRVAVVHPPAPGADRVATSRPKGPGADGAEGRRVHAAAYARPRH